jgi:hypothetical protein
MSTGVGSVNRQETSLKFHPRVEAELDRVCKKWRLPRADVLGDKRRRTKEAVEARHSLVNALFDPETVHDGGAVCRFRWSASEVARRCGLDHTSVLHALCRTRKAKRRAGLPDDPPAEDPAVVRERRARMRQTAQSRAEAMARRTAWRNEDVETRA